MRMDETMSAMRQMLDTIGAARDAVVNSGPVQTARAISNSAGAAPLHAMVRQGGDEIAQILPAFPDSNVRNQAEMGQLLEITPQAAHEQVTGKNAPAKQNQVEMEMDR